MYPKQTPTLHGSFITLRPMAKSDANGLFACAENMPLWKWYPTRIESLEDMTAVVNQAIADQHGGLCMPFTIVDRQSGSIAGSSRFFSGSEKDLRTEIGWTWIAPRFQGGKVNLESKFLMFQYAFEQLYLERVELKTDARNVASQKAMLKLGLVQEGIMRSHMRTHEGYQRDSVYFSVIKSEWPEMKKRLQDRLNS